MCREWCWCEDLNFKNIKHAMIVSKDSNKIPNVQNKDMIWFILDNNYTLYLAKKCLINFPYFTIIQFNIGAKNTQIGVQLSDY